jgi:hypothetical protein
MESTKTFTLGYNEHFVPKTPSGNYSSKTKLHDNMHIWLREPENVTALIYRSHKDDIEELIKAGKSPKYRIHILSQEHEEPVYLGTYLVGVPDCVVTYDFEDVVYNAKLVIELKPYNLSTSGVISQLKLYANAIAMNQHGTKDYKDHRPKMAVLTHDHDIESYELLDHEGIHITHIGASSPLIQSDTPRYRRANLDELMWRRK